MFRSFADGWHHHVVHSYWFVARGLFVAHWTYANYKIAMLSVLEFDPTGFISFSLMYIYVLVRLFWFKGFWLMFWILVSFFIVFSQLFWGVVAHKLISMHKVLSFKSEFAIFIVWIISFRFIGLSKCNFLVAIATISKRRLLRVRIKRRGIFRADCPLATHLWLPWMLSELSSPI